MKLIVLFLNIFPFFLNAQSIFDKDLVWSTMEGSSGSRPCGKEFCWSYFTKITGDTVINNKLYKLVLNASDSEMKNWFVVGYMREEEKKIFYRRKNNTTDCLLYDFGCSEGDTLNLNCSCPVSYTKFRVDSIKSILISGIIRKHFYLKKLGSTTSKEYWIEGIGCNLGILNGGALNHCMTGQFEQLLCCSRNGKILYKHPDYAECYLGSRYNSNSMFSIVDNHFVKIYPNPAIKFINLSFGPMSGRTFSLEIVNINGEIVKSLSNVTQECYYLDVRNLNRGIYFVKIQIGKEMYSRTIILQ